MRSSIGSSRPFMGLLIAASLLPGCACDSSCPSCPHRGATFAGTGAWEPLFNGKDLRGWTVKCRPADLTRQFWRFDDGAILADSMGAKDHDYVWLVTDRRYGDFILHLRFQVFRDSPGNSGVQIRSHYDDEARWLDGPQIDINPPGPWRTGMIWDETRGSGRWLWPEVPNGQWVHQSMANPDLVLYYSDQQPAWNDLEITAISTKITVLLNGVKTTDYDGSGVLDDDVHRKRNVGINGQIALQIHKADQLRIRFKDIYIRDLSK